MPIQSRDQGKIWLIHFTLAKMMRIRSAAPSISRNTSTKWADDKTTQRRFHKFISSMRPTLDQQSATVRLESPQLKNHDLITSWFKWFGLVRFKFEHLYTFHKFIPSMQPTLDQPLAMVQLEPQTAKPWLNNFMV